MDPRGRRQLDRILEEALKLQGSARAAFLHRACAGDSELRQEIDAMLDAPVGETETRAPTREGNSPGGRLLGHYRIDSLLGKGGMGEVYRAHDTRLDREVAIKILPAEVAADPDRVRRFIREAKAASALNHPNIITIHEVDQSEGTLFIATELVQGESLERRAAREPLSPSEALDVAIQVASALVAAHDAGIVHRDIKPQNIMLRPDGYAKVLDFGIAKLAEPPVPGDQSRTATIQTEPGVVVGTPRYMSPEQISGQEIDGRSDIFSLGIVLYEMLAGRPPFEGSTRTDALAAVLTREPAPLARYLQKAPPELERIVSKALRKNPDERYQIAREILLDLKNLRLEMQLEAKGMPPPAGSPQAAKPKAVSLRRMAADEPHCPLLRCDTAGPGRLGSVRGRPGRALDREPVRPIAGKPRSDHLPLREPRQDQGAVTTTASHGPLPTRR